METVIAEQYNTVLKRSNLNDVDSTAVLIREVQFPGGWSAPNHFHSADLFIYVIEGAFEATMEGERAETFRSGQALEMRAGATMLARNASDASLLKLAVFQVGHPNAPFVVPVEE